MTSDFCIQIFEISCRVVPFSYQCYRPPKRTKNSLFGSGLNFLERFDDGQDSPPKTPQNKCRLSRGHDRDLSPTARSISPLTVTQVTAGRRIDQGCRGPLRAEAARSAARSWPRPPAICCAPACHPAAATPAPGLRSSGRPAPRLHAHHS